MKRIICLLTALCLVFGSFSFVFAADQAVSDSQTHTLLGNLYNLLNGTDFKGRLNNIHNKLVDINSNLVTLMGWLDPSNGGSTTALLNQILNALVYTDAGGAITSWLVDIQGYNYQTAERILDIKTLDNVNGLTHTGDGNFNFTVPNANGGTSSIPFRGRDHNWRENLINMLLYFNENNANIYKWNFQHETQGYDSAQSYLKWDDLTSSTFTPISSTNGLYNWLSKIQAPTARLAYVLASDERIAAQEAAAANEEAVVNNFIDSTGAGSASPSDIGSISDLSSGYQNNFGSDASVSGIFNIFNSNNMGWFSQETVNQLDTTTPTRRGSSFDTPLLDQQIYEIYDQIGVKHD